nr:MAG TPA: hypothetical protein [Caudoviricetes sp.]
MFDYGYIITRTCVFVNRYTSILRVFAKMFSHSRELLQFPDHLRYLVHYSLFSFARTINPHGCLVHCKISYMISSKVSTRILY